MGAGPDSVSFDRIAARYDETRGGEARGRRWAEFLEPHFADRGRTLEAGVGTGLVALGLLALGRPVVGVDLSSNMLALALPRLGPRIVRGDVQALPFGTGAFRNAYSTYVLHLVGDLHAALRDVARVLDAGGRYLVVHSAGRETDPISEAVADLRAALGRPYAGTSQAILEGAARAGFTLVEVVAEKPHAFTGSPAAAADEIEAQTFSWTWDLPPGEWERHVVRTVERLRAMPEASKPMVRHTSNDLIVLERLT